MQTEPIVAKFVAYCRVSTERQGRSGLGLEAQHEAVLTYLQTVGGVMVDSFVEVESGRNNDRPQLAAAMKTCRLYGAKLVFAKFNRMSRNAHFLLGLQQSGVEFVAADMPSANNFTVGVMALVAQHEAEAISARTKAALTASKARGTVLGGFRGRSPTHAERGAGVAVLKSDADSFAQRIAGAVARFCPSGTLAQKAAALNSARVTTRRGGSWSAAQVKFALDRAADRVV